MKQNYGNVKTHRLSDFFPIKYFRLISYENKDTPYGKSEIPVFVDLKKGFSKKLSFKIPWDGELSGFLRNKKELFQKIQNDKVAKISINNWDNKFIVILEDENGNEVFVFSTSEQEVINLLEGSLKPPKLR